MLDHRKLKLLMLQNGIDTQEELAERLGYKPWTLTRTIRGQRKNPQLIKKLERFFRQKPGSLMRAA